ncbi:MAG: heat-inducible transcriptional repressor HrcA [bacterium]
MANTDPVLNERARHFLKVLVERYIQDGQPVGSRTLSRDAGMDLSPATIRNVMADLEEVGLISSPHTSAGRIPTISGYRVFVDSLISLKPMEGSQVDQLRQEIGVEDSPHHLIESASKLLSNVTHMAGVVMIPGRNTTILKEIQFISLSSTRVLVVMVSHDGEVLNRIMERPSGFDRNDLESAARFLNERYSGLSIDQMRALIVSDMSDDRKELNQMMSKALEMANQTLERDSDSACVVAGQTNLMDFDEFAQVDTLRKLFDAFSEKQEILNLLDNCAHSDGIQIYIGNESGYGAFQDCSVVTAPYQTGNEAAGVLGVIGPTRMAYDRVIPIVDVTAKLLGAALKSR